MRTQHKLFGVSLQRARARTLNQISRVCFPVKSILSLCKFLLWKQQQQRKPLLLCFATDLNERHDDIVICVSLLCIIILCRRVRDDRINKSNDVYLLCDDFGSISISRSDNCSYCSRKKSRRALRSKDKIYYVFWVFFFSTIRNNRNANWRRSGHEKKNKTSREPRCRNVA